MLLLRAPCLGLSPDRVMAAAGVERHPARSARREGVRLLVEHLEAAVVDDHRPAESLDARARLGGVHLPRHPRPDVRAGGAVATTSTTASRASSRRFRRSTAT